jgi:hypothetical protein
MKQAGASTRTERLALHRHCRWHDYRQRNFSGSSGDDAGCGLSAHGVSGLDRWRTALVFGALTYAELGALRPLGRWRIRLLRDAYGPLPDFFTPGRGSSSPSRHRLPASPAAWSGCWEIFRVQFFFPTPSCPTQGGYQLTYGHLLAIAATILISALGITWACAKPATSNGNDHAESCDDRRDHCGDFSATTGSWETLVLRFWAPRAEWPALWLRWSRLFGPMTAGTTSTW